MNIKNNNQNSKPIIISILIFLVITIILFIYLYFYFSNLTKKPFHFSINKNEILIEGWNSTNPDSNTNIKLNDINSIELLKTPLVVNSNNGGGQIGNKIFGDENLYKYGSTNCFIENLNNNTIYIKTSKENYAINFISNKETINKYNEIKTYVSQ